MPAHYYLLGADKYGIPSLQILPDLRSDLLRRECDRALNPCGGHAIRCLAASGIVAGLTRRR